MHLLYEQRRGSSFANREPRLPFFFPLDTSHAAGVENGKGIGDIEMAITRRVGEGEYPDIAAMRFRDFVQTVWRGRQPRIMIQMKMWLFSSSVRPCNVERRMHSLSFSLSADRHAAEQS